ncbi:hypothetical protein KEM56_007734 [Ascosphaera pollenicola]|nr:hypothetical protein KEM56_007734 [Ascosphaera pollenicola]
MSDITWVADNYTHRNPDYIIWAHVESCVGVISSCLPMFKPLFRTVFKSSLDSYGRHSDHNKKGYRHRLHPSNKSATDHSSSANRMEEDDVPVLPKLSNMDDFGNELELQERGEAGSRVSVVVSDSSTTATIGCDSSLTYEPRLEARTGPGSYGTGGDDFASIHSDHEQSRHMQETNFVGASINR